MKKIFLILSVAVSLSAFADQRVPKHSFSTSVKDKKEEACNDARSEKEIKGKIAFCVDEQGNRSDGLDVKISECHYEEVQNQDNPVSHRATVDVDWECNLVGR